MYTSADDYADNSATTGALSVGSQVTGNIEIPHDADWFKVNLKIGTTYIFELNPSIIDGTLPRPYLTLYDSSNYHFSLKSVSNGGLNNNPLFSYTPMLSGDYYLGVSAITSYGTEIGTYTLKATIVGTHQNNQPTGEVTLLYGTLEQGNTVLADATKIADLDGLGTLNPFGSSFQWLRNGTVINGANSFSYVLTAADVGKSVSVKISYTDGFDTQESITSNSTILVAPPTNHPPTGSVNIIGDAVVGKMLTVTNDLRDDDGIKDGSASFQWLRNETQLLDSSGSYTLKSEDIGSKISFKISYIDGLGNNESVESTSVKVSAPANHPPTGSVNIIGDAVVGQLLTVNQNIVDNDGIKDGSVSFQWLRNEALLLDSSSSYTLKSEDIGSKISFKISYVDGLENNESVESAAIQVVSAPVNNAPTGSVNIIGDAVIDGVLSLTNTIKDADGLGEFSYLWESDSNILESDNASLKITNYELGQQIWATISYTDGAGNYEEVKSPLTQIVKAQVIKTSTTPTAKNDLLTGSTNGDVINGLAGNDTITGGLGADKLTGGKGVDIFKYTNIKDSGITATKRDIITDFSRSEKDKIDLSAIDANEKSAGDQAFTFVGTAAFSKTNAAGQLRFDATSKILYGSTDADTAPEFSIQLNGVSSLVAADFIL